MHGHNTALSALEFFAGGGMARLGVEAGGPFRVVLANDNDHAKCVAYRANFGDREIIEGDVAALSTHAILDRTKGAPADLAWASFPCQDLSLAGARAGMAGAKSSAFFGFWRKIEALHARNRPPAILVVENVPGLLSAHGGSDFGALVELLALAGYRCGAFELDACHFVPQSRPRLFVVAARGPIPRELTCYTPDFASHPTPKGLSVAVGRLSDMARDSWVWWRLPPLPLRNVNLVDVIESALPESAWHTENATQNLLAQMGPLHRQRLEDALARDPCAVGTVYRRTRIEDGRRIVRAEVRFDGIAGCLRTPAGGSSRQILAVCEKRDLRTRLMTARETARLMGLPEDYQLPNTTTAALHLTGDGVVVPLVQWLTTHLLVPLAKATKANVPVETTP